MDHDGCGAVQRLDRFSADNHAEQCDGDLPGGWGSGGSGKGSWEPRLQPPSGPGVPALAADRARDAPAKGPMA